MSDPDKEKGLYKKFYVRRIDDALGKHEHCFKYVLDLEHDPFAIPALKSYIEACQEEYPLLATALKRAILAMPVT